MAIFHYSETACPHFSNSLFQSEKMDVIFWCSRFGTTVSALWPGPGLTFKLCLVGQQDAKSKQIEGKKETNDLQQMIACFQSVTCSISKNKFYEKKSTEPNKFHWIWTLA